MGGLVTLRGMMGLSAPALDPFTYYSTGVMGLTAGSFSAGIVSTIVLILIVKDKKYSN